MRSDFLFEHMKIPCCRVIEQTVVDVPYHIKKNLKSKLSEHLANQRGEIIKTFYLYSRWE